MRASKRRDMNARIALLAAGRIDFNMGGNMFEQFNFVQNDVPM